MKGNNGDSRCRVLVGSTGATDGRTASATAISTVNPCFRYRSALPRLHQLWIY